MFDAHFKPWFTQFIFDQFSRYAFLTTGILYGLISHARLSKKEAKVRVIENEQKRILDEELAVKRAAQIESKLWIGGIQFLNNMF